MSVLHCTIHGRWMQNPCSTTEHKAIKSTQVDLFYPLPLLNVWFFPLTPTTHWFSWLSRLFLFILFFSVILLFLNELKWTKRKKKETNRAVKSSFPPTPPLLLPFFFCSLLLLNPSNGGLSVSMHTSTSSPASCTFQQGPTIQAHPIVHANLFQHGPCFVHQKHWLYCIDSYKYNGYQVSFWFLYRRKMQLYCTMGWPPVSKVQLQERGQVRIQSLEWTICLWLHE